jgi:outer membrane translocation and assembly module TamA
LIAYPRVLRVGDRAATLELGNAIDVALNARVRAADAALHERPFPGFLESAPSYRSLRNVQSYDLAEDVRFGPDFDVSFGLGLEALGGDANYQRAGASLGWTLPWCRDGFVRPSVSIATKRQPGVVAGTDFIDSSASTGLRVVSPTYRIARLVAQLTVATRWNPSSPGFFFLGSDDGLRGYSINEFAGQRLARANFELRAVPRALWFLRVGAVAFYDVGVTADTFGELRLAQDLHHDVGVGARALVPQSNRELFRFDLALPLADGERTRAGALKFIASFEQAF